MSDFFKPGGADTTVCKLLLSQPEPNFLWAPRTTGPFLKPDYMKSDNNLGGTRSGWLSDNANDTRSSVSIWGTRTKFQGGCCHFRQNDRMASYGKPFVIHVARGTLLRMP